jgi:hypothetical protein
MTANLKSQGQLRQFEIGWAFIPDSPPNCEIPLSFSPQLAGKPLFGSFD